MKHFTFSIVVEVIVRHLVMATHTNPSIIYYVQLSESSHGNGHNYTVVRVTRLLDVISVGTHYKNI